jgi:cytosolic iron-sulfur protein assembly protein CIAO1
MEIDAKKDFEYAIEPIAALEGHADRVWAVAWNPVQPLLASCSGDKSIRLWSYRSTFPYSSSSPPAFSSPAAAKITFARASELTTGHRKTVRSVAWAPSGNTLAAGSFDSTVSIWERAGGEDDDNLEGGNESGDWECVTTLEGHESECKGVAYSNDGGLLASCSRDKSVWIWEGESVILPVLRPSSIITMALSHMTL